MRATFSKHKDRIYQILNERSDLSQDIIFKELEHLGLAERNIDTSVRDTFLSNYLKPDGSFSTVSFYSDMNEFVPNRKLKVGFLSDQALDRVRDDRKKS